MKKMLIAAAVAAIAGGVFADDGYIFSATLKTTQGRKGTIATETLPLGKLGKTFWYKDAEYIAITNQLSFNGTTNYWYDTKLIDEIMVPTVAKAKDKTGTATDNKGAYLRYDFNNDKAASTNYLKVVERLRKLSAKYTEKSAGRWCETVTVIDPASCYRVAGTKKIEQQFTNDVAYISTAAPGYGCCKELFNVTVGAQAFTNGVPGIFGGGTSLGPVAQDARMIFDNGLMGIAYQTNQLTANLTAATTLYQRFGAQQSSKATRLEIFAAIPYAYTTDGYLFAGWIAGQGTGWANDSMAANTISGNIVGVIEAADCETCCTEPLPSYAFDCVKNATAARLPYSAAYGTFRMRYVKTLR